MSEQATEQQPEEQHDELIELDALTELEQQDYNPATDDAADAAAKADQKLAEQKAEVSAHVAVAVIEQTVGMFWPAADIKQEQKNQVQQKLKPVLLKYGAGGLPPWLLAYKEELELAGVLAMVGLSIRAQVMAAKAEEEKNSDGEEPEPKAA